MPKWLKVVVGILVVVAVVVVIALRATSGLTESADAFFQALKRKDLAAARGAMAEEFRATTGDADLAAFVSSSALGGYKSASWSSRSVSGDRGTLEGSLVTETGGTIPMKVELVKEGGAWRIYSVRKPAAGLQGSSGTAIPAAPERVAMVKRAMHDFLVAAKAKDMSSFHATVSNLWQRQITVEKMNEVFRPGFQLGGLLEALDQMDPVLDGEPKLSGEGVLQLAGHYRTKPTRIHFDFKFYYEGVAWKLVGFGFELVDEPKEK
jgi:hypothetical protein